MKKPFAFALLSIAASLVLVQFWRASLAAEEAVEIAPPVFDEQRSDATSAVAVFAGGCFWGVQGVFQHVDGVIRAVSGYAGGAKATAQYERVGRGDTGHAEAVEVTYDPRVITYGELLQVFFSVAHDPTQLNRQGPDIGTQYRSAVFPVDAKQREIAEKYIAQLTDSRAYESPIRTTVETGKTFYPAETYHQDYLVRNPSSLYIRTYDVPKIDNLQRLFPEIFRDEPVLVLQSAGRRP